MVIIWFNLLRTSKLFFKTAEYFTCLLAVYEDFNFSWHAYIGPQTTVCLWYTLTSKRNEWHRKMFQLLKFPINVLVRCLRIIKIPISMTFLVMIFRNKLCIIFQIFPEYYWQWCLIDCHTTFTLILKTEKRRKASEAFICNDKSSGQPYALGNID